MITESSSARASASGSPPTTSSGQPRQLTARSPRCEDQRHRLRVQPACHERQHLRRGTVQPLLVIDQADQRLLLGRRRTAGCSTARPTRNRSGARPGADAERGPQRVTLRSRAADPGDPASARTAAAAPRTRSSISDWTASGPRHPAARGLRGQVIQQRCLADAWLAGTTSARLSPARTASTSWSSTSRSRRRPVSPVARPGTAGCVAMCTASTLPARRPTGTTS